MIFSEIVVVTFSGETWFWLVVMFLLHSYNQGCIERAIRWK